MWHFLFLLSKCAKNLICNVFFISLFVESAAIYIHCSSLFQFLKCNGCIIGWGLRMLPTSSTWNISCSLELMIWWYYLPSQTVKNISICLPRPMVLPYPRGCYERHHVNLSSVNEASAKNFMCLSWILWKIHHFLPTHTFYEWKGAIEMASLMLNLVQSICNIVLQMF